MTKKLLLAVLTLIGSDAVAQQHDNACLMAAVIDVRSLPDAHYVRYVSVPASYNWRKEGNEEAAQLTAMCANYWSLSPNVYKPRASRMGFATIVRLDLSALASGKELDNLLTAWELLEFDPVYSRIITPDTLRLSDTKIVGEKKRAATEDDYDWELRGNKWHPTAKAGLRIEGGYVIEGKATGKTIIRTVSPHLAPELVEELIERTHSQAPIVSMPYLIARGMRSLKRKDELAKALYDGLYYELANVPKAKTKGSDEDALFSRLSVGNIEKGISAKDVFDNTPSDRRTAQATSDVTGKPRQIHYFPTLAAALGNGRSILVITQDLDRDSLDLRDNPLDNLLDFRAKGKEIIWERANGFHGFAIADAKGKFLDQVPDTIASDRTVPAPHPTVLEAAHGCISCHKVDGGWRKVRDDVATNLKGGRFAILGDLSVRNQRDAVERIRGLYEWNPEEPAGVLPQARNDLAKAIIKATGPWKRSKSKPAQLDIVTVSGDALSEVFNSYWYDRIDAKRALEELGHKVEAKDKAADMLLEKLGVTLEEVQLRRIGELNREPVIRLVQGGSVHRNEFDLVRSFLATRMLAMACMKGL